MAPKKTLKISNDTPQIKKTLGRPKKIRGPALIKIEIPVQQKQESPRKYSRKNKISLERKIELANEVVRTQLTRKVRVKHDTNVTELAAKIFDCATIVQNNVEEEDKKVTIRKVTRKGANKKTEPDGMVKPSTTRKRAADSTQQPTKKRKVTVKETVTPKTENVKKQTAKPKRVIHKKKTIQGKKKNKDVVCAVQNSLPILDIPVEVVKDFAEPNAAAIDSRKTSMTSASGYSWTKDISSSSTTTCVTVSTNDFVRIDKKLPVLQLINVDREVQKYKRSEIDDSTSDSNSSSSDSISHVDLVDIPSASLNLSTSSPSTFKVNQNCTPKSDSIKGDVTKALVKLSSMLKNFDMEIMNWIGYGENVDDSTKKCNEKILKVLKEECHVIAHCRQLKHILTDKETDEVDNTDAQFNKILSNDLNVSFDDDNPITKDNVLLNENVEYPRSPKSPSTTYDSDFALDNYNCMSLDRNNDDDDALSLFAESITGIEPSRTNDSNDSPSPALVDQDEYIPQPLNKDTSNSSEKYEYCPTKITNPGGIVKKNVCEKQSADSTSIYKEVGRVSIPYQGDGEGCASEPPVNCGDNLEDGELASTEELPNQIGPPPVTSIFQQLPWKRSTIFRGICFYNLMNMCKKKRCSYPHLVPSTMDIKAWLVRLSESMFIEEYIFLSSWPILRRKYGFYFIEECHRRGLPRIIMEMAIDFIINVKPKSKEDSDYQLLVLEHILLCLNDVGLVVCEDLLNRRLDGDIRLCDVLMRVMAISQNFSRFKHVFLNLTNVMVRNQRTFSSDIVEQILERVCILPAEERLLRSVFDIIKNTDSCILSNKMMCHFETRLRTVNSEWHEEFVAYRNANFNTSFNVLSTMSPLKGKDLEPLKLNCINKDEKERYTSPDTTKVDTLQYKPAAEPVITRTVNLTRTCYNSFNSTPTKNNVEDWLNNKFHNWRQNSPMPAPIPLLSLPPMTRPRNGRVVTNYRTSPTKYRHQPPRKF